MLGLFYTCIGQRNLNRRMPVPNDLAELNHMIEEAIKNRTAEESNGFNQVFQQPKDSVYSDINSIFLVHHWYTY